MHKTLSPTSRKCSLCAQILYVNQSKILVGSEKKSLFVTSQPCVQKSPRFSKSPRFLVIDLFPLNFDV